MASGLRARLNAIAAAKPVENNAPARSCGVAFYSAKTPLDPRLNSLAPAGLRRIGWKGPAFDIDRTLFLDTETTGLSGGAGTVAFLVGLGFKQGNEFAVEQYLMRDYSDEAEMLARIMQRMRDYRCICSFNGKNFDLPLLEARTTMCRMHADWPEFDQLDLLFPARRTWKQRIGSCRLSRIEEMILGQGRTDDLPGSEVPQRYFDYLKSGDMALLDDIVAHNRQDIITLGTLLAHLCELYQSPQREKRTADLYSMGRALENQGELRPARELYHIAAIPAPAGSISTLGVNDVAAMAAWREYILARRSGDYENAREILEHMANRRQLRNRIYIEMAKLYEHHYKNYTRALRYADLAVGLVPAEQAEQLERRRNRLRGKIAKTAERTNKNGTI